MSRSARQLDLLHLHANVTRRVRNLETGVHPLAADADWDDSIPPTELPKSPVGSTDLTTTSQHPHYQKRSGIGSLMGVIVMVNPQSAGLQAAQGGLWNVLPDAMRPTRDHSFLAWADRSPYIARVLVLATGDLRLLGGPHTSTVDVYIDGLTWPVA